jgi:hypothetical protein
MAFFLTACKGTILSDNSRPSLPVGSLTYKTSTCIERVAYITAASLNTERNNPTLNANQYAEIKSLVPSSRHSGRAVSGVYIDWAKSDASCQIK